LRQKYIQKKDITFYRKIKAHATTTHALGIANGNNPVYSFKMEMSDET